MLITRIALVPVVAALYLSVATDARADGATECNASYEEAEVIVHATRSEKLLSARDKLRVCSRPVCKAWMVKECTKWLDEVEGRIPTVVLVARDGKGAEIADAAVTLDGASLASSLDGRALALDPGEHTFVFTRADGKQKSQRLIVKEGMKAQLVSVSFDAPAPPTARPSAPAPASTPAPAAPAEAGVARLRIIGFAAGGVGIAGLALGGVLGLRAMGKKSDAECVNGECEPGALSDARSAATLSTISFAAGGILLAGGITLVVIAPRFASSRKVGLGVTPSWIGMEGTW